MGDQPLYTVTAQLTDAKGQIVDTASRRIGLRKVEVLPPKEGVAMHLRVNGAPVFAKGADWIPADNMPTRVTPEILRWYMTRAVECNFNFIRLWGGGYYEEDELFDLCDELGLMLQFEFKFANASYPVDDKAWMDKLQAEIEEQTRRCRNHPSIVIWSGNNEIQYFKGYDRIFEEVIGGIVRRLREQVIEPARRKGYREIWLTGASQAGMGALFYEYAYPGDVTGLVLYAPFMGSEKLVRRIAGAGGPARWQPPMPKPPKMRLQNYQVELWRLVRGWGATPDRGRHVWLACGKEDGFLPAARLIATQLPPEHFVELEGGHDWDTWDRAATQIFNRIAATTQSSLN